MKFIHYISKVSGIDMYGLTSLLIFFIFFALMITWVFSTRKKTFREISQIPLDN
jgi:cbb3-type cytochrome oxidase subunit 3